MFCVMQIIGVVNNALDVAFVIANFHLGCECVHIYSYLKSLTPTITDLTPSPSTKREESKASPPTPLQGERGVVCFVGLLVEQLTSLPVDELISIAVHSATKHLA